MWQSILALLIFSLAISPTRSNTIFIHKSCNTTLYPQLCYLYLSRFATRIGTSPRLLAQTALAATLSNTRQTTKKLLAYSRTHKLTKREMSALKDCFEEIDDSAYELHKSMVEMGKVHMGSEFSFNMNSIETWVSAALTDDDTCTDGFSSKNMNGELKIMVRKHVLNIAHLASVALSFVNNFAKG
ncbi:pectinesterase inhibitor domain-containing protein [Artemisia annua]|uniref:Pectinesterase inhibitor domain-containing protein n=1 Tax=Artemisia annua TaxID=35608 RepID=A0A2U1L1B0_ARTAN|nr:pectinesterase inhibitor domain-containing protein [Artemisia annua]PWA42802.1 pectinesterase inhibitor domain-containing protein [Artemisia annua]